MTKSTTDIPILDDDAIAEIEAQNRIFMNPAIDALCNTVRVLRADLQYRCESLEELRRCRDRWLTMLNPASADETVDGAIRNLQQAYISERDNAVDLQSQLEQVTKERNRFSEIADKRHEELCTARRQRDDLAAKCAPYLEQLK